MTVLPLAITVCVVAVCVAACGRDRPESLRAAPGDASAPAIIHTPDKLTSIETKERDGLGRPVRVSCITCHATRDAGGAFPESAASLREFHVGLSVRHGTLGCASCHAPRSGGAPMLRLASGEEIETASAMRLCAQCHGPKFREYEAGRHGGMSGHWDLSQGPRLRNHCVDCHDPHAPAFAPSMPVLKPNDRFLTPPVAHAGGSHG